MALSRQGSTQTPPTVVPARKAPRSRVVRLGPPANDNAQSSVLVRILAAIFGGAVVVLAMRWLGVL